MQYNKGMTLEEIQAAMKAKKMTLRELANQLAVHESNLGEVLKGRRKLTETLARHIEYVLGRREAVLVYRVDVSTRTVQELTAGRGCVTDADHLAAMQAIAEYNLRELEKIGAQLDWSEEERRAFGLLEAAEEEDPTMPAPDTMPVPYVPAARGIRGPQC